MPLTKLFDIPFLVKATLTAFLRKYQVLLLRLANLLHQAETQVREHLTCLALPFSAKSCL